MEKNRPMINLKRLVIVCFVFSAAIFVYCVGTEWTLFRFGFFITFLVSGLYFYYVKKVASD